jgi:putative Holliday junction resolvase
LRNHSNELKSMPESTPEPLPPSEQAIVEAPMLKPPFPKRGRLLGVDYGTKRLGFAVCTEDQTIASPIENYTRQNLVVDAKCVKRLVSEYRVVGLVVGLPVHMSGDESKKSLESRQFGDWLQQLTNLPVTYADERYSSMFAEQFLVGASYSKKKRQSRLDMLAAQVILQGYLDGRRTEKPAAMSDDL